MLYVAAVVVGNLCTSTDIFEMFRLMFPSDKDTNFDSAQLQIFNGEVNDRILTSRAEANCRGRRVAFRSCELLSRSKRAPAIAVSSSEGLCRDGELRAILLMAAMIASDEVLRMCWLRCRRRGGDLAVKKPV